MDMKKLLMLLVLAFVTVFATSCNTFRGAGEDVQEVGDSMKDAAN
jgi:predicted small secreted protein